MTRDAIKRHRKPPNQREPSNVSDDDGQPQPWDRLPWETSEEYGKFTAFKQLGPSRSVREAYRGFTERAGKQPKDNPPSTWYLLYNGNYLAFRQADARMKAIEIAEAKHNRAVDWDAIYAIVEQAIDEGELPEDVYRGEYGEAMTELKVVEVGFMSLVIGLNGDPLPDAELWEKRLAAGSNTTENSED